MPLILVIFAILLRNLGRYKINDDVDIVVGCEGNFGGELHGA
jgi:hypothetical protein